MFLNHLWLREMECPLVPSSDDSWTRQSPFPWLKGQSVQRVLNPLGTKVVSPLSWAEMQMKIELRELGGGTGISMGIPSPTAKSQQPHEDQPC